MNIQDLREAQARFEKNLKQIAKQRLPLHEKRAEFVRYYTRPRIRRIELDDYVIGVGQKNEGEGLNFCYTLERDLDGLGRIIGSTAYKFGVYYGRTKKDSRVKYRFTGKYGSTPKKALEDIKECILHLLEAGEDEDLKAIEDNKISPMFKGKILSTYFPGRYLNVFSDDHLSYYLTQLGLDTEELIYGDPVYKREALLKFKDEDPYMRHWPVDLFSYFLYQEYPGRPKWDAKDGTRSKGLDEYEVPAFPPSPHPEVVDLSIMPPEEQDDEDNSPATKSSKRSKPNYEKQARKLKLYGDRGEEIVLKMEEERWEKIKGASKKRVKRVSLESDDYGYDILSYEADGTEKYIEVKATTAKLGPANFFLSRNELRMAKEHDNYYIYMVYDIMSYYPKIWPIKNPFKIENKNVVKKPITYRISINAK
jgi:hypothetical protein